MIDPVKMLADVPGALHVSVLDAEGVAHDGVMTSESRQKGATDYGFPEFAEGDDVYVAPPFSVPPAALCITHDGATTRRRIRSSNDWRAFVMIQLGEVLA